MIKDKKIFDGEIGLRVKSLRTKHNLSAQVLAEKMSFNSHQIILNIESGKRKVSSTELLNLMDIFNVDLDYFSDPYLITENDCFSWRAKANSVQLNNFEKKSKKWLGMYRRMGQIQRIAPNYLSKSLEITKSCSAKDSMLAGESLAIHWELGKFPAKKLVSFLEKELQILVIYTDAPKNISGAAFKIPGLSAIIVNKNETEERVNFTIAHELFHILTWDKVGMKPEQLENEDTQNHIETLANSFASGLLIPKNELIEKFKSLSHQSDIAYFINKHSQDLGVSASALLVRIQKLKLIEDFPKRLLNSSSKNIARKNPSFSGSFINRLYICLKNGDLSVSKALNTLECSKSDLIKLFEEYNLKTPFDL